MTPKRAERPPDEDEPELSNDELRWFREQYEQHKYRTWLGGQIRSNWTWVVSVVGALVGAIVWIKEHVKW